MTTVYTDSPRSTRGKSLNTNKFNSYKSVETENGTFDAKTFYAVVASTKGNKHFARALCAVATEVGLPTQRMGLILALIALAKSSTDWFFASHLQAGKQMYRLDPDLKDIEKKKREKNIEDQFKQELDRFTAWEKEAGITLVEYKIGCKADGENIPSQFKLHILDLVQETLKEYPVRTNSKDAMTDAARVVVSRRIGELKKLKPKVSQYGGPPPSPSRWCKSAVTATRKYAEEMGPTDNLLRENAVREVISELHKLIVEYKREPQKLQKTKKSALQTQELSLIRGESRLAENGDDLDQTAPPSTEESQGGVTTSISISSPSPSATTPQTETEPIDKPFCDSSVEANTSENPEPLPVSTSAIDQRGADLRLLAVLNGVDAYPDQVLLLDDTKPKGEQLQKSVDCDLKTFTQQIEELQTEAEKKRQSLVVRVRGPVYQTEDCNWQTLELLRPFALAGWQTSPDSYHVWFAFNDEDDKHAVADRLLDRVREILPQSRINKGAGGATRWIGTHNFKPNRQQSDGTFPVVELVFLNPGRIVTPSELDEAGLLAPLPVLPQQGLSAISEGRTMHGWPSYEIALAGAKPRDNGTGQDLSNADARWATYAFTRYGKSREEVACKLAEISQHEHSDPIEYGVLTANEVADWLQIQHNRIYL